jgi:EAL domain-containing protein (putative c-di-GMP-specific phosphodiesterase class I)
MTPRPPISALAGTLYIGSAGTDLESGLVAARRSEGVTCVRTEDDLVCIEVHARSLAPLISELSTVLNAQTLDRCPATFVPVGESLRTQHLAESGTLRSLTARIQYHWLRELLDNERLLTYFQPIVRIDDPTRAYGYECLVRAADMADRLVYPARLFRAAEEAGLLAELDAAAHATALRSAAAHGVRAHLFLNVHPGPVSDGSFRPKQTVRIADELGMDADQFIIEVTESASLDATQAGQLGTRLRRYGVRIALDDLGAGYATLSLLADLRPDYVKLDMRLIREVDQDSYRGAMLDTLVELARRLGIRTVGEGVETEGQWRRLASAGVDLAQGYLFGHPSATPAQPSMVAG